MWAWQHCFASLTVTCQITTGGELAEAAAEYLLACVAIVAFFIGLLLAGEWVDDRF